MAAKQMPNQNTKNRNDYVTNKVLTVFSICLLGVLGLMALNNMLNYSAHWQTALTVVQVLRIVGVIVAAAGALWLVSERKKGKDTRYQIVCGRSVLVLGIVLAVVFSAIGWNPNEAIKACYVALPAFAFYYLIFHSYQPEFFVIAADCGLAAGVVALAMTAFGQSLRYVLLVAAVVVFAVQLVLVQKVKGSKGKLVLGKKKYAFDFSKNAYLMMTLTPVVMAVIAAVGALSGMALPALIAAGVYFFVTAVYYTVKLV